MTWDEVLFLKSLGALIIIMLDAVILNKLLENFPHFPPLPLSFGTRSSHVILVASDVFPLDNHVC